MVIMQLAAYALIFYRDILMSSQKCLKYFMMGFVVSSCFEEKLLPDSPPKRFVFTNFLIGFSSCCVECFHLQIC